MLAGASAGLLFGHMLTYLVAFPASQRARVLANTEHASWFDTIWFMAQVGILTLIPVAVRTLRRRAESSGTAGEPEIDTFWWLFVGFVTLDPGRWELSLHGSASPGGEFSTTFDLEVP